MNTYLQNCLSCVCLLSSMAIFLIILYEQLVFANHSCQMPSCGTSESGRAEEDKGSAHCGGKELIWVSTRERYETTDIGLLRLLCSDPEHKTSYPGYEKLQITVLV